jgi:hypothetical protein
MRGIPFVKARVLLPGGPFDEIAMATKKIQKTF